MGTKRQGRYTVMFEKPPIIRSYAAIVGEKESEGPLGAYFDTVCEDPMMGQDSWEAAEGQLQYTAVLKALDKAFLRPEDIDYLFAGDLLGQTIATSFGVMELQIPHFGLYGACSTMGESLSLASMAIDGGFASRVVAVTSSHFASAEKQFRYPLGYGNQRSLASTWTVTGSGALVLENAEECSEQAAKKCVRVHGITTGKIMDYGIKDSQNMGACMAPAAALVIASHLKDMNRKPEDYDRIITGDLGTVGQKILFELMREEGYDIEGSHMDCGIEIFDHETQDTHAGGSGCGCSAVTLCSYVMHQMEIGEWKRVLFVPTGALLSKISFNEGLSIPGIAHGVVLEKDG
ncbi:stage V sporulation protein AD [Frisingicoccus caecimuris]|uniref:Stage V sporulation protein AD n=1 Tax=Frisingicoccus caecimuris TaxID=1796636 RepID=A0A4R2LHA5_9FIRM|nr:stage V sporulation protein AD [Frisingicoccus caecimuris]MCR1918076.1 stage V sporulation protein AD [Frisingicoccus caecimuris]TCO85509.1 stage V sporulation protein AD [Frisingicoccus caecimuris]